MNVEQSMSPSAHACLDAIAAEWFEGGQSDLVAHTGHPAKAVSELVDLGLLRDRTIGHVMLTEAGKHMASARRGR